MRIVLLGKTGVGKSATGNTILGNKLFTSRASSISVTEKCHCESNPKVRVIDTPGFMDTKLSNKEVTEEIIKCIGLSSPGAHAFIVVVKIGRFTPEENETVNLIRTQFGQAIMQYMVVLFTGIDDLEDDGMSIADYVKTAAGDLKKLLSDCGNNYIGFNNKASPQKKIEQSRELIKLVDKIVKHNGGKCYTNEVYEAARKCMEAEVQKRTLELKKDMDRKIEAIRKDKRYTEKDFIAMKLKLERDFENNKFDIGDLIRQDLKRGKLDVFTTAGNFLDTAVHRTSEALCKAGEATVDTVKKACSIM